jgi:hypothetical protein
MMIRLPLLFLFAAPSSSRAMSTKASKAAAATMSSSSIAAAGGGWSDIAIQAAQDFTVSQRQKLKDMGALDIQRPIRIHGEPVIIGTGKSEDSSSLHNDDDEDNDNDDITKIIHFQRHGQG